MQFKKTTYLYYYKWYNTTWSLTNILKYYNKYNYCFTFYLPHKDFKFFRFLCQNLPKGLYYTTATAKTFLLFYPQKYPNNFEIFYSNNYFQLLTFLKKYTKFTKLSTSYYINKISLPPILKKNPYIYKHHLHCIIFSLLLKRSTITLVLLLKYYGNSTSINF